MKKILLFLLLGIVPQLIHAQTAKAIWCSGNTTLYFTYDTNTYAAGGTYDGQTITNVYTINPYEYSSDSQIPWYAIRQSVTNVVIATNFSSFTPTSFYSWFNGFNSLTTIVGSNYINISNATNMRFMFQGCQSLTSLDVSNWNTGKVINMRAMFWGCQSLSSLDVSRWNVGKVTEMYGMFNGCKSLLLLNVSNWDTGKVTGMESMFGGCQSLTSLDVSNWNTSNVAQMKSMFKYCYSLSSLDVSNWNTGKVIDMESMFEDCRSLPSLDVSRWNVSKVTNMYHMFWDCRSLPSLDVSNWDTGNVTQMAYMFWGCSSLSSLDVSKWNTGNVTRMDNMFSGCSSLSSLDVSKWNTGEVTRTAYMFGGCSSLIHLTFGKNFSMDKTSVFYKGFMFTGTNLRYIDFYASDDTDALDSNWNNLFEGVSKTTVIYLPHGSQTVTDKQNVVYSYGGDETDLRCPMYYSQDKVDIEFPRDFKTNTATYRRTMSNNYGSVILPYDFTTNDKVQAYTLDEEHTETMYFRDTQTVPAHTPFAFNVKPKVLGNVVDFTMADSSNSFGITVKATHTTHPDEKGWDGVAGAPYSSNTNLAGWTAKGYYVNQTIENTDPLYSDLHYIAGEKFYKAAGETLIFPPHRVTFHGTWAKGNTSGGAKSFVFSASSDEVVTAIEEAETRQTLRDAEAIYDLAGRRQHEAQKGVNIVRMSDGSVRKMFVK